MTPEKYISELNELKLRALNGGASLAQVAVMNVKFAAATWHECWPGEADTAVGELREAFASFQDIPVPGDHDESIGQRAFINQAMGDDDYPRPRDIG